MAIDRRALFLLAVLLAATGRAQDTTDVTGEERAALLAVEQRVAQLRGLPFLREVPVASAGRAALREYAQRRLERFSSPPRPMRLMVDGDDTNITPDSGSATAPCQLAPPCDPGRCRVPPFLSVITEGGVNTGPMR